MTGRRAALAVDVDMVLDVHQSLALAESCMTEGSWGGTVECFVLVMALSGLRPGEALGLLWDDVELPAGGGWGWVVVRRSHRPTQDRWLDPDEDPQWGPLPARGGCATEWTSLCVNGGRGTGPKACSSTSVKATPPAEKMKGSSFSTPASPLSTL